MIIKIMIRIIAEVIIIMMMMMMIMIMIMIMIIMIMMIMTKGDSKLPDGLAAALLADSGFHCL